MTNTNASAISPWPSNAVLLRITVGHARVEQAIAAPASVVSLNRLMNCPTWAGMTLRSACGSTMSAVG